MLCDVCAHTCTHTHNFRYEDAISLGEYGDCCSGLRKENGRKEGLAHTICACVKVYRKSWYIAYCHKIFSKLCLYDYVIMLNLLPSCQRSNESTLERSVDHQDEKLATRSRHTCTSTIGLNVKLPHGRLWFTNDNLGHM